MLPNLHRPFACVLRAAAVLPLCAALTASAQAQAIGRTPAAPGTLLHSTHAAQVETLAQGLSYPWAMAFLPTPEPGAVDGILLTERTGTLRIWRAGSGLSSPIAGVPAVYAEKQGGLLDVVLSPNFPQDRHVYLSYAARDREGLSTAVGFGRLSEDETRLEGFREILRQTPKLSQGYHFGSRLVFDRDGMLFIALGENNQRPTAQDLDKLQGKVLRLHPDGRVPDDNPFVGRADARAEIWSYGHRNQQGAALDPRRGTLWTHEHGPRGGDEINIPQAGKNYGWPRATYGINYSGLPIPEARGSVVPGTEPPLYYWERSPAISGMAFYASERFPAWRDSLFIGALSARALIRLQLDGEAIVGEEWLLRDLGARIRDVRVGPDAYVYVLTDAADGKLLRVGLR